MGKLSSVRDLAALFWAMKIYFQSAKNCTNFMINLWLKHPLCPQPYRTTPLILPGAKVNHQRNLPIESYLRHHPNPQISGPPTHDYTDTLMKQKVADSVLQRYGGDESHANGPKVGILFDDIIIYSHQT